MEPKFRFKVQTITPIIFSPADLEVRPGAVAPLQDGTDGIYIHTTATEAYPDGFGGYTVREATHLIPKARLNEVITKPDPLSDEFVIDQVKLAVLLAEFNYNLVP